MKITRTLAALAALSYTYTATAQIEPEWVRYPAISPDGSHIAFTYKGDLYKVAAKGGEATRLTFHAAHDFKPVWSNDGNRIAFASERHGNFDVFIMDANGGEATRLTYDSSDEVPYDFMPKSGSSSEKVLFKGMRIDSHLNRQYPSRTYPELYAVNATGGKVQQVLTSSAEEVSVSSDGDFFVYQDIKGGENAWRKHHRSSVTRDLWVYDVEDKTHKVITTFEGEDRDPVLADNDKDLFYLSEQNGTFNVFKTSLRRPSNVEQLTDFDTHPVRFLSQAKGTLAFSYHGQLYTMKDGAKPKKVSVTIRTQDTTNRESYANINGEIDDFVISPDGKEIAFIANGDVFVSSKDGKFTKQITDTPETEASVTFSADGKRVVYASERGLKWSIFQSEKVRDAEPFFYAASLLKETALIDNDKDNYLPQISPDGKRIAYVEDRRTLKVANIDGTDSKVLVARENMINMRDHDQYFTWSPDSQYLLFTHDRLLNNADIAVVKADGSEPFKALSQSAYYDYYGKWTMGGKAVLWFSNKNGLRSYATSGSSQLDVYATFLDKESWDRFTMSKDDFELLEAIEEANKPDDKEDDAKESSDDTENASTDKKDEDETPTVTIEWDGLEDRTARLTIHSSRLSDAVLDKEGEKLYYITRFEGKLDLWQTELRSKETKKLFGLKANSGSLQWDMDKETLYLLSDGKLSKLDLKKKKKEAVKIKGDVKKTSPELFASAFDHIWLRTQKTFYEPTYHGVDWQKMYQEYQPKVAHIDNAHEFAELVSELLGELNVSHAGARARSGFNIDKPDATARLGIFYDDSYTGNGIKVTEVIKGGPLDKAILDMAAGDIITHIDGEAIDNTFDWAKLLNRKADTFVLLTVRDNANATKELTVKPISNREQNRLLYQRFVDMNEKDVLAMSNGQLGYVHIPSMSDGPYRNVFDTMLGKHYDKKAMVVDARFNGGGDLVADLAMFFTGESFITYETADKVVGGEPTSRYTKPLVSLFNESMYSDGHCYASGFEDLDLGTSIGMPVPGTCSFAGWERLPVGIVWGMVPVSAKNKQGEWMENNQTNPDIIIKNMPEILSNGKDQQLEKAVETLLGQLN
ncbi:PDZ domain-containing protein [Alteromonas sediminis]|uniref:Tricorn protease homolog n=1 Tax=Alteromonas sediminis TaxID=2259342 RepID=A0A3N5Y4Z6_9ALTE|nr:S41 family peptidase [Alteromonas sediminis]RPJ68720.1 PDZ domain-containing protein [Alteromonas sediminis]